MVKLIILWNLRFYSCTLVMSVERCYKRSMLRLRLCRLVLCLGVLRNLSFRFRVEWDVYRELFWIALINAQFLEEPTKIQMGLLKSVIFFFFLLLIGHWCCLIQFVVHCRRAGGRRICHVGLERKFEIALICHRWQAISQTLEKFNSNSSPNLIQAIMSSSSFAWW